MTIWINMVHLGVSENGLYPNKRRICIGNEWYSDLTTHCHGKPLKPNEISLASLRKKTSNTSSSTHIPTETSKECATCWSRMNKPLGCAGKTSTRWKTAGTPESIDQSVNLINPINPINKSINHSLLYNPLYVYASVHFQMNMIHFANFLGVTNLSSQLPPAGQISCREAISPRGIHSHNQMPIFQERMVGWYSKMWTPFFWLPLSFH